MQFRSHGGELAAALAQQFLDHDGRVVDDIGVIHRFLNHADLAFLEAVEHVGNRGRFQARISNVADHAAFGENETDNQAALIALFRFETDIVETVGVPQRHEVAAHGFLVVDIAFAAENHGAQRILRDTAGTAKLDGLDHVGSQRFAWRGGVGRSRCGVFKLRRLDGGIRRVRGPERPELRDGSARGGAGGRAGAGVPGTVCGIFSNGLF